MSEKILKREIQRLTDEVNQLKGQLNQGPLRLIPQGLQQLELLWARSNEEAPSDRIYILADLLDESGLPIVEGEGHDIEVYFTVFAPGDKFLDECVPYIKNDPDVNWPIPIVKRPDYEAEEGYRYYCLWPVNISVGPCICQEEEEEA